MKTKLPTEKQIQQTILRWLNLNGIMAWRNNTGRFFLKNKSGKERMFQAGVKGSSDIFAILKTGQFVAIEVKSKYGKLSLDQEIFLDKVEKQGGISIVAYSLEDVIKELEEYLN